MISAAFILRRNLALLEEQEIWGLKETIVSATLGQGGYCCLLSWPVGIYYLTKNLDATGSSKVSIQQPL